MTSGGPLPPADAPSSWLRPAWSDPGVAGLMTTREVGHSLAPFDRLNLRSGLGDAPEAVSRNLALLRGAMQATPVWLNQVHGARVARLQWADAEPGAPVHEADASVSALPGLACAVQVADCLPVLMSACGRAVAAAHAGWRGLAGGVVEASLHSLCDAARCSPADVEVWLGACIGPGQFEVGEDVLEAFGAVRSPSDGHLAVGPARRFIARGAERSGKWLADLAGLAEDRLRAAGVQAIASAGRCTLEDRSHFFSFRRDGVTGRMAAAIWLRPDAGHGR